MLAGGVAAALAGPEIAARTRHLVSGAEYAGAYAASALIALISIALLGLLRAPPSATENEKKGPARTLAAIMRQRVFLVAVLNAAAAYVVMSFVMTSLPAGGGGGGTWGGRGRGHTLASHRHVRAVLHHGRAGDALRRKTDSDGETRIVGDQSWHRPERTRTAAVHGRHEPDRQHLGCDDGEGRQANGDHGRPSGRISFNAHLFCCSMRHRRVSVLRLRRHGWALWRDKRPFRRGSWDEMDPMRRPMLDQLSNVTAFVRVADARSFTQAAERMGLSRSAVGKCVARLEERLATA